MKVIVPDAAPPKVTFAELVGKTYKFYGVDNNCFKLNGNVWQAIEDESDGYRSFLSCIEPIAKGNYIFHKRSLAVVKLEDAMDIDGYQLVDVDGGHVWLRIGTDNWDDYYPYFVFEYNPDKTQVIE